MTASSASKTEIFNSAYLYLLKFTWSNEKLGGLITIKDNGVFPSVMLSAVSSDISQGSMLGSLYM